ncbi:hypothetical protein [uncultured Tateyamaria sp.]|uniref:hypothetical protein n=1 Tax=uncultured Tateyamaria sp. TaxID=455651 RepID=UPI00262C149A|nr:hypothetical protein [uncultured Tateyamaria sp.]
MTDDRRTPDRDRPPNATLQVSGLLILGVFFSTFLVDKSQNLGQWIGCALDSCDSKTATAFVTARVGGLAIGGFFAIGITAYAIGRGTVSLRDGMGAAIGVLAGALFSILELSVGDRYVPVPKAVLTELYIWGVVAVLMLGPILAKGSAVSARNISMIYGRMVAIGLTGLVAALGLEAAYDTLSTDTDPPYILKAYSVVTLPPMWAAMLAIPWMPESRHAWSRFGRIRWGAAMCVMTLLLAGGYGLTESILGKPGVNSDRATGIMTSLSLLLVPVLACLFGVILALRNQHRHWPILAIVAASCAGGSAYVLTVHHLSWPTSRGLNYAMVHGMSVVLAVGLSVWIDTGLDVCKQRWNRFRGHPAT